MFHIYRGLLCELGFLVVGRQGLKVTKKLHFPFNVIFFLPENETSNSVNVFLAFFITLLLFFLQKNIMVLLVPLVPLVPLVLRVPEAPRSADLKFNKSHRDLA